LPFPPWPPPPPPPPAVSNSVFEGFFWAGPSKNGVGGGGGLNVTWAILGVCPVAAGLYSVTCVASFTHIDHYEWRSECWHV